MASDKPEIPIDFLAVPQLKDLSNLKQWKRSVRQHATYHDLNAFFDGTAEEPKLVPEREQYYRKRVHAMVIMTSSIQHVEEQLEAAGWKSETENDPKVLWDLILVALPKFAEPAVPKLFDELINASQEPGVTLHAFNSRFHYLADRLTDLDVELPTKAKLLLMMKAIKSRYPQWHNFLERDFEKGSIT
ncbi:uncharacterized protein F4822DRAFT_424867 [Hypoxylon trugodes]|uniref:uncharacterized protein n=1 Tax=Hypoxylon trugodes TaxID=326681 RepID=UPI0021943F0F|nr:uncharacterized protein F4822DRAFT_424867 [Hypoxylon trugodes]KAI1394388.1 hypothetical protein F4822DRAFT_424867 [Hypoxylon trugodes]